MRNPLSTVAVAGCLTVAICGSDLHAAILFDFGPSGATANPTNSPAHAVGAVPATEVTWNDVALANFASGAVKNADNTTATGVSLTYGLTSGAGTVIDFTILPGSTSGGGGTQGIYSGGSAVKDAVFQNTTGGYRLGVRVDGLQPGQYDVYVTGRNTANAATTLSERVYYGSGSTAGTFNTAVASSADLSNIQSVTSAGANATYVLGDQYQKVTMTLAASQSMYVAVAGTGTDTRPFLNSIEIVAVPEPASFALAGLAGVFTMSRRRR